LVAGSNPARGATFHHTNFATQAISLELQALSHARAVYRGSFEQVPWNHSGGDLSGCSIGIVGRAGRRPEQVRDGVDDNDGPLGHVRRQEGRGPTQHDTIYISSAGRIFAQRIRQDGDASENKSYEPGANTYRFVGDKIVGHAKYVSGASEMIISFDPSGQSCTASIQYGRDTGRAMIWKGANGITNTATGPWVVSNTTCSIASGNTFAGQ
jgi:hypothetical protein